MLTLPNLLTLIRLVGVPLFCLVYPRMPLQISALTLAGLWLTDYFDGWTARRLGQSSHFGSIFDPLTDRLTTSVAYLWLAATGMISWWLAAVVAFRHLSQLLALPVLMLWLKKIFYVKAKAFPKWLTAYNSLFIFYPLYLRAHVPAVWEPGLMILLSVPMALCEIWIVGTYWPRLVAIAMDEHDTFE